MSSARRRFGRFERQLPVKLEIEGQVHAGTTVNLGLGGLLARVEAEAAFDTPVTVELPLPTPRMTVRAQGRVLWTQANGGRTTSLGICFDALRPIDVWGLLQYFNLSSQAQGENPLLDETGET